MKKSDLPFGSEFSPSQVSLARVLELAHQHGGDRHAFEKAIEAEFFTGSNDPAGMAENNRLAMAAYGIIEREDAQLTDFGEDLLAIKGDEPKLYDALAKHILLNLNGMTMVRCIQDMVAAGETINLTTLREGMAERGVHFPRGGKHPSMMRLWLAKAGVIVGNRWQVDPHRIEQVLGINPDEFEVLASFTPEQRAFVRALANVGSTDPQPANEIARLASATYGIKFPEKSLPKLVLNALVDAGYITADKTTTGRGAKPFQVTATPKLVADVVEPLLEQLKGQTDPKLLTLLRTPLASILEEMQDKDR